MKIIYVAFSGEEEPSEEAQKVKLEISIDKSARLIFPVVKNLCFRHIVLQVEGTSSETQELGLGGPSPQQLNSIMHQVEILHLN